MAFLFCCDSWSYGNPLSPTKTSLCHAGLIAHLVKEKTGKDRHSEEYPAHLTLLQIILHTCHSCRLFSTLAALTRILYKLAILTDYSTHLPLLQIILHTSCSYQNTVQTCHSCRLFYTLATLPRIFYTLATLPRILYKRDTLAFSTPWQSCRVFSALAPFGEHSILLTLIQNILQTY